MRFSVIFFNLLIMAIILVSMDPTSSGSSASLVLLPGRRSIMGKWSHSYHSRKGDHNVKGLPFDTAGDGAKPKTQDFTETQNPSNMDVEEMVYNIDYHGATTHPTPTPKHPKP